MSVLPKGPDAISRGYLQASLFPSYHLALELPSDCGVRPPVTCYLLLSEALGGESAYSTRRPLGYMVDNPNK